MPTPSLLAVVADGLDGTSLHSLGALGYFLVRGGLLADVGDSLIIVTNKEIGRRFAAKVAIDAIAVHIELAGYVLFIFFVDICHNVCGGSFNPALLFLIFLMNAILFLLHDRKKQVKMSHAQQHPYETAGPAEALAQSSFATPARQRTNSPHRPSYIVHRPSYIVHRTQAPEAPLSAAFYLTTRPRFFHHQC